MLNVCILSGRLTSDPELHTTDNNVPVLNFSVAVQRDYKPADTEDYPVDFLNFVAWRKTAEFIAKHFSKGSAITMISKVETRKYTDKDGNQRTATEFVVDRAYFGGSKKDGGGIGEETTPTFPSAPEMSYEEDNAFPPLEL